MRTRSQPGFETSWPNVARGPEAPVTFCGLALTGEVTALREAMLAGPKIPVPCPAIYVGLRPFFERSASKSPLAAKVGMEPGSSGYIDLSNIPSAPSAASAKPPRTRSGCNHTRGTSLRPNSIRLGLQTMLTVLTVLTHMSFPVIGTATSSDAGAK
jgi:hypothetical protein